MKFLNKSVFIAVFSILATITYGQSKQDTTMIVNGVCDMCKFTIESAATGVKGVKSANWDVKSKVLELSYNTKKVDLMEINKAINISGYDTEYSTATDEAYYSLHKCCYYRDPEVVKDHE